MCQAAPLVDYGKEGFASIHRAAAQNFYPQIKKLTSLNPYLIEVKTTSKQKMTPLLVAATYGSVEAFETLLKLGADTSARTATGLSAVQCAASHRHTGFILSLISHPEFDIFKELFSYVAFLPGLREMYNTLKVLDEVVGTHIAVNHHSEESKEHQMKVTEAHGITALAHVLRSYKSGVPNIAAVIASILEKLAGCSLCGGILECSIPSDLLKVLVNQSSSTEACKTIVKALRKLARSHPSGWEVLSLIGGPEAMIHMVKENKNEKLRLTAMECIRSCVWKPEVALQLYSSGLLPDIVVLLQDTTDNTLLITIMSTLEATALASEEIRTSMVELGTVEIVIEKLQMHSQRVVVQIVDLLKALCATKGDTESILKQSAKVINALIFMARYSMHPHSDTRYKAFKILWLIASESDTERRALASLVGPSSLITILSLAAESLQLLATTALRLLSPALYGIQEEIASAGGVVSLLQVTRACSGEIQLEALLALEQLSYQLAMRPNRGIQKAVLEADGLSLLLRLHTDSLNPRVKLQAACTLSALTIGSPALKKIVLKHPKFSLSKLIELLGSEESTRMVAKAICYLAYNSLEFQCKIMELQKLPTRPFYCLLASPEKEVSTEAAFQMIVLARVLETDHQATILGESIRHLARELREAVEEGKMETQVHVSSLICALLHTRAGISNGILSLDIIPLLVKMLLSPYEHCRKTSAIALNYLTRTPEGARTVLQCCRRSPRLFKRLRDYSAGYSLAPGFLESWEHYRKSYLQGSTRYGYVH